MTVDFHNVVDWVSWWVLFWSIVNFILPPRETFKDCSPTTQKRYNTLLMLVAFYGSLNVRQLTVRLYDSVGETRTSPTVHSLDNALVDAAASTQKTAEAIDKAQESIPIVPVNKGV